MKAILILAMFALSFGAMAQEKTPVKQNDLKGPEYKNFRFGKNPVASTKVQSAATVETVQGPAFKNRQQAAPDVELAEVSTGGTEQQKLQGPAYKNFKH